ncbi:MAG: fructose 1,6-bisphosphatase [Chloroflexi bacterium]|nr:MAG: fructose 1,6-bisphosphatase [Chloroflexota bacterium]
MSQTLSVIKADIGGWVGHTAVHPELLAHTQAALARAVSDGLVIDAQAHTCGDDLFLIISHERGENDEAVHRLAWETFESGAVIAKRLGLHGAGQDLVADAFTGSVRGAGPGSAELTLEERPSEPVLVFLSDKTAVGAFNLPLYRMFADPFNTPGLIMSEPLHDGFSFEVHDRKEQRKIVLTTPDEAYGLLGLIGSPGRFAVKRVISRRTNEVAAVCSIGDGSQLTGRYLGEDDPAAIVRCQGNFPAVGEALEPFGTPWLVLGGMRDSHYGPWMPVAEAQAHPSRFDGPARVVALGFQLHEGRLGLARDLFEDPAYDRARAEANRMMEYMRMHGPFEPHLAAMDEMERESLPATAKLATRWTRA